MTKSELKKYFKAPIYMHEEEVPIFCYYASLSKNILVEIGAGYGSSAFLMLASSPGAHVYSIDPFTGDTMKTWRTSEKICRRNISHALNLIGMGENIKYLHLCTQTSHQVAIGWNKPIDFLYIDGDHRYEAVKQDFNDWFKHVRSEGTMLLHDSRRLKNTPENKFNRGWPGPTMLAEELKNKKDLTLIDEVYSLTIWRKK